MKEHKDEAFHSLPDDRCAAVCSPVAVVGGESWRRGAGVHRDGEQRQDRSSLGLPRKICCFGMAQQWMSLRAEALQQREYAAAAKTVDGPRRRVVHHSFFRAWKTGLYGRE